MTTTKRNYSKLVRIRQLKRLIPIPETVTEPLETPCEQCIWSHIYMKDVHFCPFGQCAKNTLVVEDH